MIAERFEANVDRSAGPDACHVWTASRNYRGYGQASIGGGKSGRAHRLAWELAHGSIPVGMWVLHKCDNPPCVNVAHLFLGTSQDNVDDRVAKGRTARGNRHGTHVKPESVARGPRSEEYLRSGKIPRGSRNGAAKLNELKVVYIRALVAQGQPQQEVAAYFDVSPSAVHLIMKRKTWQQVPWGLI